MIAIFQGSLTGLLHEKGTESFKIKVVFLLLGLRHLSYHIDHAII